MGKGFKTVLKLAAAAAGICVVGKYLHDYTDYKAAEKEDLEKLKNGGEKAKEAAKRTYIALKNGSDVTKPAGELGSAVAETADGAGQIVGSFGANTKKFVMEEKERYAEDPAAYRAQIAGNLKDMGQQATGIITNLKETAEGAFQDVKATVEGYREEKDDFVESRAGEEADAPYAGEINDSFEEIKQEHKEAEKIYAQISPAELKKETEDFQAEKISFSEDPQEIH